MAIARVAGPLLRAIAASQAWLTELQVPVAVIGGVAASLLGRPRVTKDVDLVVLADEDAWRSLLEAGLRHGVEARIPDALEFARTSRVLLLRHQPTGIEVDLSFAALPFELELIERASVRVVRGVSFRVATPEDIVIMKSLALRPRDIADIEAILEAAPELDLERVRSTLRAFTEALETDDFAGEFERILKRTRRA
ncbi:MAG TPA: nucleotidyl transferase AbiEii/AbiGii toxin family protein [Polyangiaceae bacterium]|nr:nucleotidyl transferase AbiEii/AbiGii toxin family protein [Polyangiaceae bacterium]